MADENFPHPSVDLLRGHDLNIKAIREIQPGLSDKQVLKLATEENRTILTHDSDYGELIFKYGFKPKAGVIYFRLDDFSPSGPGELVLDIIHRELTLANRLTLITDRSIRQRGYK
ncbi:MAG TPA: DUF5615 family PIN-like protein [Fodinibius sp.]|nr:DUF5615 family PIN-like protein [Fodinibius sp.]